MDKLFFHIFSIVIFTWNIRGGKKMPGYRGFFIKNLMAFCLV